jgi:hypothetical protein
VTAVVELTDEEKYLLAILDGTDGIDISEFCWIDEEKEDRCFRCWDFQWPWYTTENTLQIDQAGRSLGKSTGIQMRAFAFPFNYAGAEMLITAPELNHLRPLTDAVEGRILASRMAREMLPKRKGNGLARQPHWQATFANGARIISRLPNKDGRGVKGMHPTVLEGDEMQDFPLAGWIELVETHKRGSAGSQVRFHGVSRGVRDKYWELTQPDSDFLVHRYMANHRPTWTKEERQEKIKLYQSRQSVDYRRNIYGEHGDASNPVFVLAKLMSCVDIDEGSTYNTEVYTIVRVDYEQIEHGREITSFLDLPGQHLHGYDQWVTPELNDGRRGTPKQVGSPKGYSAYFAGMDVGVTNHPSEILVFGQRKDTDFVECLLRVHLRRIGAEDQIAMIEAIFEFYGSRLKAFAMDKTGVGQPIWDILNRKSSIGDRIYGYNFSEKVVTGYEDRAMAPTETQNDLAIWRNVVEHSTDVLRNDMVDVGRIRLPFDRELLSEWQGQSYTVVKSDGSPYGKRNYSAGKFHTLDAGKMMAAGKTLPAIAAMLDIKRQQAPVYDLFLGASY